MRQKIGVFTAIVAAGAVSLPIPTLDLPRTHYLNSLYFSVACGFTNTNGGGTVNEDGLARALRFRLFLEGDDPVISLRGDNLKTYLTHHYSQAQDYTEVGVVKGAGTASWNFELPIADRRLRNDPRMTKFDLALSDNPRIEMDFPANGLPIETTGDCVLTSLAVTVSAEMDLRPAGMPGPDVLSRYLVLRRLREFTNPNLVASTTDQQSRAPFGRLVREYHMIARSRAASPARSDSLVAAVDVAPNLVRAGKELWQDMKSATRAGLTGVTPLTGAVVKDFDPTRQLVASHMLNLVGTREMDFFVDTNALANDLDFTVVEESIDLPSRAAFLAARKFTG